MRAISQYLRKLYSSKILIPIANIRKQGIPSETLALSIAIGIIGGAFPVLGLASYVCLMLTLTLKQNIIIVQVVNWLVYPIQILLLIPFMKLGNSIFSSTDVTITIHQVVVAFQSGIMNGIKLIGIISVYGIITWTVFAIPTTFILYFLFLFLFRNIKRFKLKTKMVFAGSSRKSNKNAIPLTSTLILETVPSKNNGLKSN